MYHDNYWSVHIYVYTRMSCIYGLFTFVCAKQVMSIFSPKRGTITRLMIKVFAQITVSAYGLFNYMITWSYWAYLIVNEKTC